LSTGSALRFSAGSGYFRIRNKAMVLACYIRIYQSDFPA
jgi:hypothetical protein